MILRRGPDHRRAADVDVLDRFLSRDVGARHGLLERIERRDDEVDWGNSMLLERGEMLGHIPAGEEPSVDSRMERLDPTVEHFREPGDVRHLSHRYPGLAEELRGAPGRENLDAERGERLGERDDPGLVVDADQSPADLHRMITLRPTTSRRPSAKRRTASGYRRCSSTRIRADSDSSVSSGCTSTLVCKIIGPVSTGPSPMKWTVAPATFAPCSRTCRCA